MLDFKTPIDNLEFRPAKLSETTEIAGLVNRVFRGKSGTRAWTGEAHLLDGQRIDEERVVQLVLKPQSVILVAQRRAGHDLSLLGCVHIERRDRVCYLGMLTVDIDGQKMGIGRRLMTAAEQFAKAEFRVDTMEMTVISIRTELIDWYQRRGYVVTDERRPFPYDDRRFGIPKRSDLEFVVLQKSLC